MIAICNSGQVTGISHRIVARAVKGRQAVCRVAVRKFSLSRLAEP